MAVSGCQTSEQDHADLNEEDVKFLQATPESISELNKDVKNQKSLIKEEAKKSDISQSLVDKSLNKS